MSSVAFNCDVGGKATLPVLDIFETSANFVLNPMSE